MYKDEARGVLRKFAKEKQTTKNFCKVSKNIGPNTVREREGLIKSKDSAFLYF